jgi:ankyrin repeat protein
MSVFKRWQRPASGAAKEHFVISHFDAYQDGALAETETAVYKQHLKTCSECREWVQQQKNFATQLEMERAPVAVLAPAAAARIQQNLYQSMRRAVIMNNVRTSVAAVGALAVLALVVGAAAWWQSSGFGTGVEAPAFGQGAPLTLENPSELDSRVIEAVGVGDVDALAAALEKGADPNAESSPGRPALYLAARRGNAEAVRLLIDAGADLEAETAESSILAGAAFEGHREVVEILLNAGTDINTTGAAFGRGGSALYSAVVNLQPEVAKLLIERGADVNQPDLEFGETPLIPAAARNLPEIVALLLENGADIDHQDNLGRTALHYAAFSKYGGISSPETAQVLIDYGAALDIKDAEGLTPLDIALPDVAELLREAGATE